MEYIVNEHISITDRFVSQCDFHIYTGNEITFVSASNEIDAGILFVGYITKKSFNESTDPVKWDVVLPIKRKVKHHLHRHK